MQMLGFFLLLVNLILDKVIHFTVVFFTINMTCFWILTVFFWLGLQKHSGDARAFSFLRILELIPHTTKPPQMLFVENVVGFEV